MRISRFSIIFGLTIFASSLLLYGPAFVYAASSSVQVGQPSNTGVDPAPGTTGGGAPPTATAPQISRVAVTLSYDSATINWVTNDLALSRVSWGTSPDYRDGTIAGEQYTKNHSTLISDLVANKRYYFQIISIGANGAESRYGDVFVTLNPPDTEAPSNVSEFSAIAQLTYIQLSWNNPPETDFTFLRIVKSDKFFPLDPLNGEVIYEGSGRSFSDFYVTPGIIYYYTVFARDVNGNYSSGSVAYSMIASSDGVNTDPTAPAVDIQLPSVKNPPLFPSAFKDFNFSLRDGLTLDLEESTIPVGQPLEISIPKDRLPDDGSFLTLTVEDPGKKMASSTYLFFYDQVNQNYKVKTQAFKTPKNYSLVVTVFNSTKLIIEKVSGSVEVVSEAQAAEGQGSQDEGLPNSIILGTLGVAAVIVTVHFWRLVRIRKRLDATNSLNVKELK